MNKTTAILLAAGKSERFGNDTPKPFLLLNEKVIYHHSLDILLAHSQIDELILVLPKDLLSIEKEKLKKEKSGKTIHVIAGGETRFESVQNALEILDNSVKNVIIHDAARPFVSADLISKVIDAITPDSGALPVLSLNDTIKKNKVEVLISYLLERIMRYCRFC